MASLTSSGLNAGYVEQLLEQYRDNPEAVDPAWRELFERTEDVVVAAPSSPDRTGDAARRERSATGPRG